jgi:glycosyltransferase involved in cell wall biosynthesis
MVQRPLVSVVIPTYNRAGMIVAAIESVFAQTYPNLEIVVVDDGSYDGTADVIKNLDRHILPGSGKAREIRYVYQTNMGQSRARNTGIALAQGNWIAFLDSDDYWLPDKIEWQLRAIEQFKGQCGVCISDARLVNKSDDMDTSAFRLAGKHHAQLTGVLPNAVADLAKGVDGSWVQALVVRSDLAKQIGGFDADLRFMEDHDFLFRLSLVTPFCYVNFPLVVIDRTSTATDPNARVRAWDSAEFRLKAQQHLYEKWLTLNVDLPTGVRKTIVRNLRAVHSAWANLYLQCEQFDLARRAVSKAISYEVTPNLAIKLVLIRIAPRIAKKIVPAYRHRS